LEAGTGITGVHLHGVHLRLPGCGTDGPTLEIFQYNFQEESGRKAVNRLGYAHIAFSVEDVPSARQAILQAGGTTVGEVVVVPIAGRGKVTWCYVRDPEGNIIELQSWAA
jgi:catechol 2,3-dioxygenase-like lactoylglutathione lyase family enzyme